MRMTKFVVVVSAVAALALSASTAYAGSKGSSFNISGGAASASSTHWGDHSDAIAGSVSGSTGNGSSGGTYYAKAKTTDSWHGSSTSATVGGSSYASSGGH